MARLFLLLAFFTANALAMIIDNRVCLPCPSPDVCKKDDCWVPLPPASVSAVAY